MRVTDKILDKRVRFLNELTENPSTMYTKTDRGLKANIGNYYIESAYGGVQLVRITNEGGAVEVVSSGGRVSKKELYNIINSMINLLRFG